MEKNLQSNEAAEKLKKLVEEIRVCMFITNNRDDNEHTRPMYVIDVDDSGTLWFFTDVRSIKVEEVSADREVHLTFAHPGKDSYLDFWGTGSVSTDRQLIKDKWSAMAKPWFPGGEDDPNIAVLKVVPTDVYYWESESGKMMQFIKMAAAAVTGKPAIADGAEGKLQM